MQMRPSPPNACGIFIELLSHSFPVCFLAAHWEAWNLSTLSWRP